MMMLVTALQAAVPAPAPAPTLAQITMPIVNAACRISDSQGHQHDLVVRQTGGRAYTRVNSDGSTWTPRTPVRQQVARDTAGIFDGFEFQTGPRETWPGRVEASRRSGPITGRIVQVETIRTDREDRYAILIRRNWPKPDVQILGFCDVKKAPQAPLNAAETEEAIRQ